MNQGVYCCTFSPSLDIHNHTSHPYRSSNILTPQPSATLRTLHTLVPHLVSCLPRAQRSRPGAAPPTQWRSAASPSQPRRRPRLRGPCRPGRRRVPLCVDILLYNNIHIITQSSSKKNSRSQKDTHTPSAPRLSLRTSLGNVGDGEKDPTRSPSEVPQWRWAALPSPGGHPPRPIGGEMRAERQGEVE